MKGIVTDIQRFSLHDGNGIRTTVFLKGCNMACAWCHNPETIKQSQQVMYYSSSCINCLKCSEVCKFGAHKKVEGKHVFNRELCTNCGECTKICYPGALVMSGRELEVSEVMEEVIQDIDYYKNSGGGVTLSGGEVFVQADFAFEVLKQCKELGINTAIESNMNSNWETMEKVLKVTDLIMLDIKHMHSETHKKWTGIINNRILENIKRLSDENISMIIRTPIIPGVNDTEEAVMEIASFVSALPNVVYYELLNFNPLGDAKYKALSIENKLEHLRPLSDERMSELKEAAKHFDIVVKVG